MTVTYKCGTKHEIRLLKPSKAIKPKIKKDLYTFAEANLHG